jgi:hypothetical protein
MLRVRREGSITQTRIASFISSPQGKPSPRLGIAHSFAMVSIGSILPQDLRPLDLEGAGQFVPRGDLPMVKGVVTNPSDRLIGDVGFVRQLVWITIIMTSLFTRHRSLSSKQYSIDELMKGFFGE